MATEAQLQDGPRDGDIVEVTDGVTRLLSASEAPGLVDVYEQQQAAGNGERAVFAYAGQEPTGDEHHDRIASELQHPHPR